MLEISREDIIINLPAELSIEGAGWYPKAVISSETDKEISDHFKNL